MNGSVIRRRLKAMARQRGEVCPRGMACGVISKGSVRLRSLLLAFFTADDFRVETGQRLLCRKHREHMAK